MIGSVWMLKDYSFPNFWNRSLSSCSLTLNLKLAMNKFEPKIVKPKQFDKNFIRMRKDQYDDIFGSIANKPKTLGDALKAGEYTKAPTPKSLKPPSIKKSNVIPFPKKPPGKADGGSIDKALPGRSRDI